MSFEQLLNDDIPIYQQQYRECSKLEKIYFRAKLLRYKHNFKEDRNFMKWFLKITIGGN